MTNTDFMIDDAEKVNQCPEFPYFGASYPDATCIDGYLWDLDKFDNGMLYGGGEEPCPFCNTQAFIQRHEDELNGVYRADIERYIANLREKYQIKKK